MKPKKNEKLIHNKKNRELNKDKRQKEEDIKKYEEILNRVLSYTF